MEKRIYVKPELELLEFNVEAGFAVSLPEANGETTQFNNGGTKEFEWENY